MFNKGMGLVGVSIVICMAILTGLPAQAAQPVQGSHPDFGHGNVSESAILGFAQNLTSTLSSKGIDVSTLNAALVNAQNAVQSSNSTAFKESMKTFNQELQADIKSGTVSKSDIQTGDHAGLPGGRPGLQKNGTFTLTPAMETKELGFAQNLTSTLSSKGIDVSSLNAALVNAQNAVQSSNSTAFKESMKTFNQELQADIKSGTISKSDIQTGDHAGLPGDRPGLQKNGTFTLTPAMETKELGNAQNLTSTLSSKGIDVSSLNAALATVQNAMQDSNSTAFMEAIKTFNQEVRAEIKSGAIPRSDQPLFAHAPVMGNRQNFPAKDYSGSPDTTQT